MTRAEAEGEVAAPDDKTGLDEALVRAAAEDAVVRGVSLARAVADFEAAMLAAALRSTRGAVGRSAKSLDIPERTLRRYMRSRGVTKEAFRVRRKRQPPGLRSARTASRRAAILDAHAKLAAGGASPSPKEVAHAAGEKQMPVVYAALADAGLHTRRARRPPAPKT